MLVQWHHVEMNKKVSPHEVEAHGVGIIELGP
jgi:hypothetical protein